MNKQILALAVFTAALTAVPSPSRAAENYANCNGFIDSVPAVISTQGVWCLRADLSTAITSGPAIRVDTNNVTIACNDFKLGGLAGGPGTDAFGIVANNRRNITVRGCAIRGFRRGVSLFGDESSGHLVERNRLDGNRQYGILVQGDASSMVRGNRVMDTGGHPGANVHAGISSNGGVIGNTVDGVVSVANNGPVYGILIGTTHDGMEISRNRVRSLSAHGTGLMVGVSAQAARAHVMHNKVVSNVDNSGNFGILTSFSDPNLTGGNRVSGFTTPFGGQPTNAGPNYSN